MNFEGEITVGAPRKIVFQKLQDANFFASCLDGVNDLVEKGDGHYDAKFETKVAFMTFKFAISVALLDIKPWERIAARIEGNPLGTVGRLTAISTTVLSDDNGGTKISYVVDANLTGKLGSFGQPVLRAKAKSMELQFATKLQQAFADKMEAGA